MEVISENSEQEACPGTTSVGVSSGETSGFI